MSTSNESLRAASMSATRHPELGFAGYGCPGDDGSCRPLVWTPHGKRAATDNEMRELNLSCKTF